MGLPVLILGESGTGKSASMRNFTEKEIVVINVANKPLPFKTKIQCEPTDNYQKIVSHLKKLSIDGCKSIVIDDAQYLMANEFMRRAMERGYDKFTEIAQNFWNLVNCVKDLPNDVIVYFLAHIERDQNGNEKIKTIGKLLDEKITVEGMFTIVLKTNVTDGVYSFLTQNSGHDTVKSPIGMFPSMVIDNDLKYVDEKIRNYYELGEFLTDEEMAEIDETVKRDDIPIKEEKKKRGKRRGKEKEEEPTEAREEEKEEAAEKSKRSRRKSADAAGDKSSAGGESSKSTGENCTSTRSRRRKSVSEELAEEREEVQKENELAIANQAFDSEEDQIPYEEAEEPELKELPKRKRRTKAEPEPDMNEPEEAPKKRRRRKA